MDLTYKQEVGVGALVIVGALVVLAGAFWLTGKTLGTSGVNVDVMFESVAGLKQGDPVLVSGVKQGRVARVHLERVKSVRVTLELSSEMAPHIENLLPSQTRFGVPVLAFIEIVAIVPFFAELALVPALLNVTK